MLAGGRPGIAQDQPASPGGRSATTLPEARESAAGSLTSPPADEDTVILLDEDGKAFRLPAGATVSNFLKWLEASRNASPDADAAVFYVAAVSLEGAADIRRGFATLDAAIDVFVRAGVDSVRVPLRMNEATLIDNRSSEETVEFIPGERGAGLNCRLLGSGRHTIHLKISVPIRSSGNSFRLQLTLPGTAQSSLRLTVPGSNISVRPDELIDIEVTPLPDNQTELVAHGLGASLDLPWQSVAVQPEVQAQLQVESLVTGDVSSNGVALEALQTINATRGSFETLTIQIPDGYSVLSVVSPTHEALRTSELQNNAIRARLPSSTAGPVQLKWLLSSTSASETGRVEITSLFVENAIRQDTFLGISVAEGFRVTPTPEATSQAQRIRTSSFRKKVETHFDPQIEFQHAWRLSSSSSRIAFRLDRIAARYRVNPSYELLLRGTTAELTATYSLTIFRGSLDQLCLNWSGYESEEWQPLEIVEPADRIEVAYASPSQSDGPGPDDRTSGGIDLNFVESLNRTHGKSVIRFRTSRPITEGQEPFLISLPMLDESTLPVTRLTVRNDDAVESTLDPLGGTAVRPISRQSPSAREKAESSQPPNLTPSVFECTSPELQFRATVTTQPQEMTATSRATLTLTDDRVSVEQHLLYSVNYEEVDRLRILVPASVPAADFFYSQRPDGTLKELDVEDGGLELDGLRQVRVKLPGPMLGRFEIVCRYSTPVDITPGQIAPQNLPVAILQPAEIESTSTRLEVRSSGNLQVGLDDSDWTQELTLSQTPSWITTGARRSVDLTVISTPERATQNFSIRRSALRTLFDDGISRTRGVYLIDGDITYLTVTLPSDANMNSVQAFWDGVQLNDDQLLQGVPATREPNAANQEGQPSTGQLRLLLAPSAKKSHLLAIEYTSRQPVVFGGSNSLSLQAPEFASDVWLAETLWDIVLPFDQHLFIYPQHYTPRFNWQRRAIVWSRQATTGSMTLADWMTDGLAESDSTAERIDVSELPFDPLEDSRFGNVYRFSSFGHQHPVRFQSMSQPAIVLAGAGLTLAMGIILLRIPITRHVLTLPVVGFCMALAGLWRLEAVQILVQPALIGLALALVLSVFEARFKKRRTASMVTLASPSDFFAPGSSREEVLHEDSQLPQADAARAQ